MSKHNGKFIWYDVMTTDVHAAKAFYSKVIGWAMEDSNTAGQDYIHLLANGVPMGGLMALPPDALARGVPPCWSGYIAVEDVDVCAKRIAAAGGSIIRPPEDIPGLLRFSVVADPGGAVFVIMKGLVDQDMPPPAPNALGHVGWRELQAPDVAKAFEFYGSIFRWTKSDAMDMGPMGIYQMFKTGGEFAVGGMMKKVPEAPCSFWLYYFNVDAIDAAIARVTQNGGKILHGPAEVPGPMWIAQCMDPQGAMFAMVASKR